MRAGELRHLIHIQSEVGTSDGMGGETVEWKDFIACDEWAASTAYVADAVIKPTTDNGYYYVCSRAGTSGETEPTFPTTLTDTVNDPDGDGAQWTCTGDGEIMAAIYPMKSKEAVENLRLELSVTHKIRIRYMAGITSKMRILFGSRIFNIVSIVNPDERNIYLEFLAEES